jgi:exosortase D (VPLPA-CTERM-specific)
LSHFLEGWVIFVVCILLLFLLTWVLLALRKEKQGLVEALDLDMSGLWQQAGRIRLLMPSRELIGAALVVSAAALLWQVVPPRQLVTVDREPFALFPTRAGEWTTGAAQRLDAETAKVLGADDYLATRLTAATEAAPVELFMAYYKDQLDGGTHSPTDCLPAAGWEIASLTQVGVEPQGRDGFIVNRAVIRKGLEQMLVYYWYEQQGQRTASSYYAKLLLTWSKLADGRSDGALVRLITPIREGEAITAAEGRLRSAVDGVVEPIPRFVPA